MANIKYLYPFILAWEGGYVNNPDDSGGPTNRGVTLATWRLYGYDKDGDGDIDTNDVKLVSEYDAVYVVMKPLFWDRVKADQIQDQSVANIIVDWIWMSGFDRIKNIQRILGVSADGVVGPKTLRAINSMNGKALFSKIWQARKKFYYNHVAAVPKHKKFLNGWMNRLNSIGYGVLKVGNKLIRF